MQEIRTAITLIDNVTPSIRNISNNVNSLSSQIANVNSTSLRLDTTDLDHSVTNTGGLFSNLRTKILAIGGALASLQGLFSTLKLSDEMTNISSRLDLMRDKYNTLETLQNKIMQSANNTLVSYTDMADVVGRLGNMASESFVNNDDVIAFSEQINKLMTISGTSAMGKQSVLLQLTQALASGVLRGQELNSILENAPMITKAIADGLGVNIAQLREMGSKGQLTANVVKNAIYKMADQTNAQFDQMSNTFADIFNIFKNNAIKSFMPLFEYLREISSSEGFKSFMSNLGNGLSIVSNTILTIFKGIGAIGNYIADNWRIIVPIVSSILAPLIAYKGILIAISMWQSICIATQTIFNGVVAVFNTICALNPLSLILLGVATVIGVVIGLVFYFSDSWQDAISKITGYIFMFGGYIANVFGTIYNIIASVAEFFINAWNNPIYSVKNLFVNLATSFLDMVINMGSGWDKFATAMANGMISSVNMIMDAWNSLIDILPASVKENLGLGKATHFESRVSIISDLQSAKDKLNALVGDKPTDYTEITKYKGFNLDNAYNFGANFGMEKVTQAVNITNSLLNGVGGKLDGINDNTKLTADKTNEYGEELKYMRDIAERETINRFTTAEVKIDMTNNNSIAQSTDINSVIDVLTAQLRTAMNETVEEYHIS